MAVSIPMHPSLYTGDDNDVNLPAEYGRIPTDLALIEVILQPSLKRP